MSAPKTIPYKAIYFGLAVAAFACWCLLILGPPSLPARGLDFRIFYTAASLPLGELYELENQAEFQRKLWKHYGDFVTSPFPRPPFYALLLKLLAWMSYPAALHLWLVLLFSALVASVFLLERLYGAGPQTILLLITYYPVSVVLRNGQDGPFLLLAALMGLYWIRRGREWAAALCLAFLFQKFNLVYLLPLLLLLRGRRSLLVKLLWILAGLALLSVALVGTAGIRSYLELLTGGSLDEMFWDAWNLRAMVWNFGWNPLLYGVLTVAVAGWFVWLLTRLEFETAFWFSFAASLILSWHCYNYDYTIVLPFLYLAWARHRVYLAGACLAGVLWPHFFYYEAGLSAYVTLGLLLLTVETALRIQRNPLPETPMPA